MKRLYTMVFLLFSFFNLKAQSFNSKKCEFVTIQNSVLEIETAEKTDSSVLPFNITGQNYIIPTVVHVVYHTGTENVPDSIVYRLMEIINQDFSRSNPDTVNTPAPFAAVAGKAPFTFCLTDVDTNGNVFNGIDRVYSDTSRFVFANNMKSSVNGGAQVWNTNLFFNIWIGNAEYFNITPTFPVSIYSGSSQSFGLAADYRYALNLSLGDTSAMYSGRSLTHDLGHCFGLSHTFNIAGCADTDTLSDTPISASPSSGCLTFPYYDNCTSTFPGVMFMNFMDLSDENCSNLFTIQQITKMTGNIQTYLPQLLVPGTCLWNSIDEFQFSDVSIFPNPVSQLLNIEIEGNKIWDVQIINQIGEEVLNFKMNEKNVIDMNNFPAGIYLIKIFNSKSFVSRKIIKM